MKGIGLALLVSAFLFSRFKSKAQSVGKYKISLAAFPKFTLPGNDLFGSARIELGLKIENPTPEKLTVQNVEGELYVNGQNVGSFKTDFLGQVSINPNSTTVLPVAVNVNSVAGVIGLLVDVFINKKPAVLRTVGAVQLYGLRLPFDFETKLSK